MLSRHEIAAVQILQLPPGQGLQMIIACYTVGIEGFFLSIVFFHESGGAHLSTKPSLFRDSTGLLPYRIIGNGVARNTQPAQHWPVTSFSKHAPYTEIF